MGQVPLRVWNECSACGFQGTMLVRQFPDEACPEDEICLVEALCPACETWANLLLSREEYAGLLEGSGPPDPGP